MKASLSVLFFFFHISFALHHNFVVRDESHTLIGPIGKPYGFVQGGTFSFDMYDFSLSFHKKQHSTTSYKKKSKEEEDEYVQALSTLNAGFALKKFASETDFVKYQDELKVISKNKPCILDPFLALNKDDDDVSYWNSVMLNMDDDGMFKELEKEKEDKKIRNHDQPLQLNQEDILQQKALILEYGLEAEEESTSIYVPVRYHNDTWITASVEYTFETEEEEGLYFLLYQVCDSSSSEEKKKKHAHRIHTSFEIDFHYKNMDPITGTDTYLTAGDMPLPIVFFYFFVCYFLCTFIWICNIRSIQIGKPGIIQNKQQRYLIGGSTLDNNNKNNTPIYHIHHLMSLLLVVKTLTVGLESVRYHYIKFTGHAQVWSFLYYAVNFIKSMFLFSTVLLIGSGWSFVKPYLNAREKYVLLAVLILQVLDNIALILLDSETEKGERKYDDWSAILHVLDILCCCAVLIPVVWQVNSLQNALEDDHDDDEDKEDNDKDNNNNNKNTPTNESPSLEEDDTNHRRDQERALSKLRLFRTFYIIVILYIYCTRIAVYLFATILDYRHTWLSPFYIEFVTLFFYISIGLSFRPGNTNTNNAGYSKIVQQQRDEDDNYENNTNEIEMGKME